MEVCYTFVTLEDDVLKSPFLSCFFRYKFIQVPAVERNYKDTVFRMLFTTKIRENRKKMELHLAVDKAVEDCIKEGILAEFLREQRAEVIAISIFEYDQEKHMRLEKEESYEEGRTEGRAVSIILLLNQKGTISKETEDKIKNETDENRLEKWLLLAAGSNSISEFEATM